MNTAANTQAKLETETDEARPTITIARIMLNGPDTSSFSGWGPKVSGVGNILKNWN